MCGAARPAPAWPSPKIQLTVYGGTPPDGTVLKVITVAAATPLSPGSTLTPPASTPGMIDVVVVVVVCVTLTVPIGSAGDPAQRMDTTASSMATGSSLRRDITLGPRVLKRQVDAGNGRHARVQSGIVQGDECIERDQHLAFDVGLEARREIDAARAVRQREQRLRRGRAGDRRHRGESDGAAAEDTAAEEIQ